MLFLSCERYKYDFATKEELREYLEKYDDKFKKVITDDDIEVVFQYVPAIILEQDTSFIYIKVSISYKGKELLSQLPPHRYSEMVNMFAFDMDKYMYINREGDRLYPEHMYYQPTYGISDANEMLAVFKREKKRNERSDIETVKIILDDFGLLGRKFEESFGIAELEFVPTVINKF